MTQEEYVLFALSLAQKANSKDIKGNPFVGAVVVDEKGAVIGTGYHKVWGSKHAEVYAIEEALAQTPDLSKCSLYVTLEPCSHHGKTPPCTDLIIHSGIKKVFVGSLDPNPKVSGFELLKQKGIDIELIELKEALELNKVFFTHQKKQKPFVAVKIAATIDGKIADHTRTSKWITNEQSRTYLHAHIRSQVDAILSTAKTVIEDQATLNCRIDGKETAEINAVIIDRTASLLQASNSGHPIFYNRSHTQLYIITAPGAVDSNVALPHNTQIVEIDFNSKGQVHLEMLGKKLLSLEIYNVLVEAGAMFSSFLLEQNWANELHYFIGSKLLLDAGGLQAFTGTDNKNLANSKNLSVISAQTLGNDIYLHYAIDSL
jgi:diaminohydroxyphosphoribosylaminopyrimidine deaminase / 5-amino-6-(5-phosphoribosylamino)uracil reductase